MHPLDSVAMNALMGVLWVLRGDPGLTGATIFGIFTAARTAHVVFYLTQRGRLRTASHTVSFLVLLYLSGCLVWQAIERF